jgi:protoporphyrinogen/coproporphyrinogen III oxidase
VFLGGIKRPEIFEMGDDELMALVNQEMNDLLQTGLSDLAFVEIYRYKQAIPQYDYSSPARLARIHELEEKYPGLILAGNIRDGIGIADRIRQASQIAAMLINE